MVGLAVRYPPVVPLGLAWCRSGLSTSYGAAVAIHGRVPTPIPAGALVVLRRAGGLPDGAYRNRPRIDAQCWHNDESSAEVLAEAVQAYLVAARGQLVNGVRIGHTSVFLGATSVPDPTSAAARYLLTVEWQVPGTQL